MIQDGIDYGEGYEKATEPGPDVETETNFVKGWCKRLSPSEPFRTDCLYRKPIKPKPISLRVGERYRMRNGEIAGPLRLRPGPTYPFCCDNTVHMWTSGGCFYSDGELSIYDIVEHIPKEQKMDIKIDGKYVTARASSVGGSYDVCLSLDEAERVGEEAKRIKAENEIKAGDFVISKCLIGRVREVRGTNIYMVNEGLLSEWEAAKIKNPTHIQALKEIYEGMK